MGTLVHIFPQYKDALLTPSLHYLSLIKYPRKLITGHNLRARPVKPAGRLRAGYYSPSSEDYIRTKQNVCNIPFADVSRM